MMRDDKKTKSQLIKELSHLRRSTIELEKAEAEHQQTEVELRYVKERYQALFDGSLDLLYVVDFEGTFLDANPAAFKLMGYERADNPFLNIRSLLHEDSLTKGLNDFNELIQTGFQKEASEYKLRRKDGTYLYVENQAYIIHHDSEPNSILGIARDITRRKQMLERLRESEERYRTIIESIEDGYYEVDLAGNLTFFNDAFANTFTTPRDILMGMNFREYTNAENAQMIYQAFNRVYRTGESARDLQYEVTIKTTGQKRNSLTSISLIRNSSGNPVGFRGISRDITDLIQAQRALKESEKRYRSIIESIEDGYYEVDLGGNLTFFNDAMVRIHEYPRVELLGMNNRQYTDAENAKVLFKAFNQVYRTGEASKGTHYEIITKDGGRKNLEASVSLIRDSIGNPIGFRGIVRDVTELRQAQKALQTSEERFRIAAQSSNDFIYEWDLNTSQINWFGDVIEELKHLLGEIPVTAADLGRIIYFDDYNRFLEFIKRHLRDEGPYKEEFRVIGREGKIIYVKVADMDLRNQEGRVYKWIGAISDISEQKKTEEELRHSLEKLRKAMNGIIRAMALTVESKDPYTAGHQQRVSDLARTIAQEMDLSEDQVDGLRMAGIVHDLGKIGIPSEILSKPFELSDIEFKLIMIHPQIGYNILKDIDFPWPVAQIVLQHHERINGSGYPLGISGEDILLEARILAVADVVEAIASHRPYRPAQGINKALEEISINKGILYDPEAVDACLRLFNEKGYILKEQATKSMSKGTFVQNVHS